MNKSSESKIAIITGSSRGIGAATALKLADHNYSICVNYRNDEVAAQSIVNAVREKGVSAILVRADISIEGEVEKLFLQVDDKLGTLTHLVNNAGILFPQSKLVDTTADRINKIFSTNVTGSILCCKEAIKRMSTRLGGVGGVIVNVSSVAAIYGSPNEYIDYAMSKGAIDTLTKGLALEVADEGIRVNAVRPGVIYTTMHADGGEPNRVDRIKESIPMKRGGRVEEVAEAIYFMLSEKSSYSTGALLDVSGGR
ncbi:MAG: NAD(P)-dependent oxidoreductase [SAR86 cluster bacterium]|uniref:NAD(P)-dependent oxidoreductase n=1 Tax=SAR86 cluster bacterium TaxID=2030880 RepID=A0A2A5B5M3_9GAMM|nr:MAG: NAD(P)-dependent oxidoreductase [SAR86 cluster bacterium]